MIVQDSAGGGSRSVVFQLYSGATCNCIPAERIAGWEDDDIRPTTRTLRVYNDEYMKPHGTIRLKIKNPKRPQRKYEADFYVVEGTSSVILSLEAMEKMELATFHRSDFEEVFATIHSTPKSTPKKIDKLNITGKYRKKIIMQHANVFNEELGCMPGKVRLEVEPGTNAARVPIRNVPLSLQ